MSTPIRNRHKILLIRNDKLGDFILSLPTYALLKQNLDHCSTYALVPPYTHELAEFCQWIDAIIDDPVQGNKIYQTFQLYKLLKKQQFDAVITLFSTTKTGLATFLSRIPYRLSPATKLAQIFYNHRLLQRRSRSLKPEFAYNMDLVRQFLFDHGITNIKEPEAPYICFDKSEINELREIFCNKHHISYDAKLIFIHAGSGGSANNLTLEQYAQLATHLAAISKSVIVLTQGPGEKETISMLSNLLRDNGIAHIIYSSTEGLINFSKHIAFADLFIAGSTGPLHIAGALNVPTVGFYTSRRSATPLRWQTLNTPDRRLSLTPPESADEMDMSAIDIDAAAQTILGKYFTG